MIVNSGMIGMVISDMFHFNTTTKLLKKILKYLCLENHSLISVLLHTYNRIYVF